MLKLNFWLKLLVTINLLIQPTIACAAISITDIQDILVNTQSILNPGLALMLAISFVVGIYLVLKGLLKLKAFAMPQSQMSQPGEFSGPILHILIGTVLIYVPTSTDVLTNTLFGNNLPSMFGGSGDANIYNLGRASTALSYITGSGSLGNQWSTLVDTVVYYMQFIGFLAFLRGWLILSHSGRGQQSEVGKGIIHIVGGILAINFLPLVDAVVNTVKGG